jgi:aldose 1-epimerase
VGWTRAPFGRLPDGTPVDVLTLTNARGLEVRAITYGGIVLSMRVPDRAGRFDDIVLGHDDLSGYLGSSAYFGAIVGRYANRIARGRFTLDGAVHRLTVNDGPHHLHGGVRGFDKVVWQASESREGTATVTFRHASPRGDQGYPGALSAQVSYTLTGRDELVFDYAASADAATPVNLSHHCYFNLAGAAGVASADVLDHELTLFADAFTPVDETLIPLAAAAPVDGTPFDFRRRSAIGARIDADDVQLAHGLGYDHNFVLRRPGPGLVHAARLFEPTSGRQLDVHTTEPGLQLYTGNRLDGTVRGKGGRTYGRHAGLCLETQHFPDSPNHPDFPSTILRPGEEYRSRTILTFGMHP